MMLRWQRLRSYKRPQHLGRTPFAQKRNFDAFLSLRRSCGVVSAESNEVTVIHNLKPSLQSQSDNKRFTKNKVANFHCVEHFSSLPDSSHVGSLISLSPSSNTITTIQPPFYELQQLLKPLDSQTIWTFIRVPGSSSALLNFLMRSRCRVFSTADLAAALYEIAQRSPGSARIRNDLRFKYLQDQVSLTFRGMDTASLCRTVTAIVKIKCNPPWLPSLFARCTEHSAYMTLHQACAVLHSICRISFPTNWVDELRQKLFCCIEQSIRDAETTSDLCSLAVAFGSLQAGPPSAVSHVLGTSIARITEFDIEDISSLAWFAARMPKSFDTQQFMYRICQHLSQNFPLTAKLTDLVSLSWAMGCTRSGTTFFFKHYLSVQFRALLHSSTPVSDFVTIAWAFARHGTFLPALLKLMPHSAACRFSRSKTHALHSASFKTANSRAHGIPSCSIGLGFL